MFIREDEKIDEIGFGGLKLIQSSEGFRYGVDAVVLADFAATLSSGGRRVFDLGTGSGVIPLILSHKMPKSVITGVELQRDSAERAERNVALNGLGNRIKIINSDIKDLKRGYRAAADIVVSNPPYMERGSGLIGVDDAKAAARASHLLDKRGEFFLVHRPYRLADIFCYARETGFEAKTMRLVCPMKGREPNIVLVHFIKGAGKQLKVLKNLDVHTPNGSYTEEIDRIYERR